MQATAMCLFSAMVLIYSVELVEANESVTIRIYSDASDASIQTTPYPGSWEVQHSSVVGMNSSVGTEIASAFLGAYNSNQGYQGTHRSFLSFDTSIIPENAQIIKSSLNVFPSHVLNDYDDVYAYMAVVEGRQASATQLVLDDIEMCGDALEDPTLGSEKYNLSIITPEQSFEMVLDESGMNWVNKSGFTKLCIREGHDIENIPIINNGNFWKSTGIAHYSIEANGTEKDPYLEITYILLEEEKSLFDLIEALIEAVEGSEVKGSTKQSYLAHLEKLPEMIEAADSQAAMNQLEAFMRKVEADKEQGTIDATFADDLISRAENIMTLLEDEDEDVIHEVDRMTQIESPFPSLTETAAWATKTYADGRASTTGDCGLTIGECGCALTTLSMLGRYRGITTGIDGSHVDPGNMNEWLVENDGYTADGSILWLYGLAYLGEEKDGKIMSALSLDDEGTAVTDKETIQTFIKEKNPAVAFNKEKGHWSLLNGVTENGYYVRDPFWYETETTNDVKDVGAHVQDYDDVVTKANLFTYTKTPQALPEAIEIVLESPAELLLTDSNGRRLGYDAGMVFDEIEGGSYDQEDFIRNPEDGGGNTHYAKRLMLMSPKGSTFELSVIGTGEGTYDLTTAVSNGKGDLTNAAYVNETSSGEIHAYTIVTDFETIELPVSLRDILALIPQSEQKKFVQAFEVVFKQTEKGHVAVTATLIQNLVRYIETKYGNESWADSVIAALEALT